MNMVGCEDTWLSEAVVVMWQLIALIVSVGVVLAVFVAMLALVVHCYSSVRNRK